MERDKLISVIVPVYNAEAYLSRCVDSILAQTYRNLEVILVDDGSKDGSGGICDGYAEKDPRVRAIHKENGGASSARNMALDIARGDYFAFADSDDWLEPDMYEKMLELAIENGVRLVCAGRYDVDSQTGVRTQGLCPPRQEVISAEEMLRRIFVWDDLDSAPWDKLYHRSLFRELRFPLGKITEDVMVVFRATQQIDRAAMYDKPVYNYFHHPESVTAAAVSEKTFHFAEHTAIIYPEVQERYPQIAPEARYFRIRSLAYAVLAVDVAGKEARKTYSGQYRQCRRELRSHTGFLLTSALFPMKERITDLLLAFGLYRWVRGVYHAVK